MSEPLTPSEDPSTAEAQPGVTPLTPPAEVPVDRQAARRAQRNRNLVLAFSLLAFIVIVYLVTVLRMGGYVAQRPL